MGPGAIGPGGAGHWSHFEGDSDLDADAAEERSPGDDHWRRRSDALFAGLLPAAAQTLYLHASLANALDLRLRAVDVVAIGPQADAFAKAALALPFTERVAMRVARRGDLPPGHPGRNVSLSDDETIALVCAGQRCSLPVRAPQEIAAVAAAMSGGGAA